ncbi:MAG: hypothetical protein ABEH58_08475 [Haloplanus sp.]
MSSDIGALTSSPSIGSLRILPERGEIAYWWTTDDDTRLRLHDYETKRVETVDIEDGKYSPAGWQQIHWLDDRFLVQGRPNVYFLDLDGTVTELKLEDSYTRVTDIDSTARRFLYVYYPDGVGPSEEQWTLRIFDRSTDSTTVLTEHPEQSGQAGFDPSDQWIAYRENPTETFGGDRIVVADAEGNTEKTFHIGDADTRTQLRGWHPGPGCICFGRVTASHTPSCTLEQIYLWIVSFRWEW